MPTQEYIKYLYEKKDMPIKQIAERTGVSWRTAKKYAHKDDWNVERRSNRRRPVMDAVAEIVDTWLLEDQLLPRKERRNAAVIYRQLVSEHDFTGGERTVREYVSKRKNELLQRENTAYVELAHAPADAQVDFGVAHAVRDGKIVEIRVLNLSFPFSNAGFAYPLPSENRECFLEGLKRLFEKIGGVPQRVRFDNLSAAVVRVGKGDARELNETFRRFCLHYRFEAEFCGPARGNEKGHVENKVGYTRRHWLCPLQPLDSYEEMAEDLWAKAQADMQRPHYKKGDTIASLWEQEKSALLALPQVPFVVDRLDRATLNNYAQFRWENHTYEVPQGQPGTAVLLQAFWDRIEVRDSEQALITTLPRHYMLREQEIDWAAHFDIYACRPRSVTEAARFMHLPDVVQRFLKEATSEVRSRRVRLMRDLLQKHPMDRIAEALSELSVTHWDDRASLDLKLYTLDPAHATPVPLVEDHTPEQVKGYQPKMDAYDRLTPVRKGGDGDERHVAQRAM